MILLGHRFIDSQNLYHVLDIDSIEHTPPSSIIYLEFSEDNLDIIKYANLNNIDIALKVDTIKEIIYASAFNARYIIVSKSMAKTAQDLAQDYLFDSKILVLIDDENDIEELALIGVDGVIFSNAIIKITS